MGCGLNETKRLDGEEEPFQLGKENAGRSYCQDRRFCQRRVRRKPWSVSSVGARLGCA